MAGGSFLDARGRLVHLAPPTAEQESAIESSREAAYALLPAHVVLERIRRHTALVAEARNARG